MRKTTIAAILLVTASILALLHTAYLGLWTVANDDLRQEKGEADISGGVRDGDTGEPIANVAVSVEGQTQHATTDENGVFVLKDVRRGERSLHLTKTGYRNLTYNFLNINDMEEPPANWTEEGQDESGDAPPAYLDIAMEAGPGEDMEKGQDYDLGFATGIFALCTATTLVLSLLALVGGYYASRRRRLPMVAAGSLAAVLVISLGFFSTINVFLSIMLSMIALMILLFSRDEYEDGGSGSARGKGAGATDEDGYGRGEDKEKGAGSEEEGEDRRNRREKAGGDRPAGGRRDGKANRKGMARRERAEKAERPGYREKKIRRTGSR